MEKSIVRNPLRSSTFEQHNILQVIGPTSIFLYLLYICICMWLTSILSAAHMYRYNACVFSMYDVAVNLFSISVQILWQFSIESYS